MMMMIFWLSFLSRRETQPYRKAFELPCKSSRRHLRMHNCAVCLTTGKEIFPVGIRVTNSRKSKAVQQILSPNSTSHFSVHISFCEVKRDWNVTGILNILYFLCENFWPTRFVICGLVVVYWLLWRVDWLWFTSVLWPVDWSWFTDVLWPVDWSCFTGVLWPVDWSWFTGVLWPVDWSWHTGVLWPVDCSWFKGVLWRMDWSWFIGVLWPVDWSWFTGFPVLSRGPYKSRPVFN